MQGASRKWLWLGAVGGLALLVGGLCLWLMTARERPREPVTLSLLALTNRARANDSFASSLLITKRPPEAVIIGTVPDNSPTDLITFDKIIFSAASSRPVRPLRTGPISDAADATSRAIEVANHAARDLFPRVRFDKSRSPAVFDGKTWVWRGMVGCGLGDVEAKVRLNPDGTVAETNITSMGSAAPVTPITPLR